MSWYIRVGNHNFSAVFTLCYFLADGTNGTHNLLSINFLLYVSLKAKILHGNAGEVTNFHSEIHTTLLVLGSQWIHFNIIVKRRNQERCVYGVSPRGVS